MIEGAARIGRTASSASSGARANLAADLLVFQELLEFVDASQSEVLTEDLANRICLGRVDNELTIDAIVTKGDQASHPHPLFLRSCDFVSNPFARDFAF